MNARQFRIQRLKSGDWQFGCDGEHFGNGTAACPREPHHHHDMFCQYPSKEELEEAGIDPKDFRNRRRC